MRKFVFPHQKCYESQKVYGLRTQRVLVFVTVSSYLDMVCWVTEPTTFEVGQNKVIFDISQFEQQMEFKSIFPQKVEESSELLSY